jgi:hypothetical protein
VLISDVITAVRAITGHDVDTQFSDSTQLLPVLAQEYRRLRRWLCVHAPTLCESMGTAVIAPVGATYYATMTIDGVTAVAVAMTAINLIPKSIMTNFERIVKVEKDVGGGLYSPIMVSDGLNWEQLYTTCVHEQPTRLVISPDSATVGTWRLTWTVGCPATIATSTALDLPAGLEDVVINRGAEFVSIRHDPNQAAYFKRRADDILKEQKPLLMQRYGSMPEPGIVIV